MSDNDHSHGKMASTDSQRKSSPMYAIDTQTPTVYTASELPIVTNVCCSKVRRSKPVAKLNIVTGDNRPQLMD